ncbi:MAG: sugar-binding protein, partial [Candidatus Thalassarchaeaceae archaeon]|nr:sugar-binding protein [Candidatus Thalassarchaeaceae archaeon]
GGGGITWDFNDGLPEGSEVAGHAEHSEDEGVDGSGALVITRAANSQLGGWLSPEIGTVSAFTIDFDILMDGGTATQADGISMAISDDLEPVEAFSEAGRGLGLRVNFDNWDNGDGAPSIEIEFGGSQIATVPMGTQAASTLDTDGWWPVHIELTSDGALTLLYNDELIHDGVIIEDFAPIENARIAFGGRTGGANANQFIDNFTIVFDISNPSVDAPVVAYQPPEGGWAYSVDVGDISSWNHDNGSDQWDGSPIGGEFGDDNRPGGVSLIDGYVRIQDTGDPRDNYPDPGSNRKIYLGQDISDLGGSDTILDDGATIHFIARIPTDGPLDPLGDEDYPAGGDGYENHDGGKGNIGIKQGAGGIISFSLNEEGRVLITEDGTELELSTTEWHEFWVTIESGDGGHTVSVYLDGSTEATVLTVAAGGGSDFDGTYLAMGVGSTGRSGALDVAAFDFAPGAIAPAGAGGGDGGGLPPELPWMVGMDDNAQPAGDGGGPNTTFVQENGNINELPGNPANGEGAREADDDYYWAGVYSEVIASNGDYTPVGVVAANEESAERAFTGADPDLRYHFNLPESLESTDRLTVSYDAVSLHGGQTDSRYGIEVYVNNVQVQSEIVIREAQIGQTYDTEPFTLADVNAEVGLGYDNIITLKGVNYNADGGGNWMGIDYVQLSQAELTLTEEDMQYNAGNATIDADGDMSEWSNFPFKKAIPFQTGTGIGEGELVLFQNWGAGSWSGPEDHTSAVSFAWDVDNLYLGVVVTDDEHQNSNSAWNGDSIQMVFANAAQDTVTHLYNYALNMDGDNVLLDQQGPGGTEFEIVRDDDAKTTSYEIRFPASSLEVDAFELGMQFGIGVCVNEGDPDHPGQTGWDGWGPHAAVTGGQHPTRTGLVTLTAKHDALPGTGPDLVDISQPGDAVVASSDNSPGGEQAPNAIDDNDQTKYLNFDGANNTPSGLTITTSGGVVTGLGLTSANDAPDRDPATFVLSGSNDGGATFTEIASGDVAVFGARFERQVVSFENEASYTTYELIFPTVANEAGANSMQIAEIELLGIPTVPIVANGSFEVDDVPEWPGYGAITAWTGGSGINDGGPFGDNGVIPDGAKLGFIQGTRTLSQQLTGLEAGAGYVLAFY